MRPLLFLALIAAIGLLPARTSNPRATHAPRTYAAGWSVAAETGAVALPASPQASGGTARPAPARVVASKPLPPGTQRSAATQWFHPAGHRCPAWEYSAGAAAAAESARVGCQKYSLRWLDGANCVPKRGPSIPSC